MAILGSKNTFSIKVIENNCMHLKAELQESKCTCKMYGDCFKIFNTTAYHYIDDVS